MGTFKNYNEAIEFSTNVLGWNEDDILERKENGLYYLTVDAGSEDVVYFEKY